MTKIDHDKFANTFLYLIKKCSTFDRPGLIKLIKLLALVDFTHYRKHLRSVTGMQYVALRMGPAPDQYEDCIKRLTDSGVVKSNEIQIYGLPNPKQEFSATRDANPSVFSGTEIEVLEEVLAKYGRLTGKQLIDETHAIDGPWAMTWEVAPNKPIPFTAVRWLDNMCDDDDMERALDALRRPHVKASLEKVQPDFFDE